MKRLIASVKEAQRKAVQWFQGGPPESAECFDEVWAKEKEELIRLRALRLADRVTAAFDDQAGDPKLRKHAGNLEVILSGSPLRGCFEAYMENRSREARTTFRRQVAAALLEEQSLLQRILKELNGELSRDDEPAGLAFSGGGIRSATFNLGVLQALANADLLRKFDYLSTVSGGGYIGSWLIAWIKRQGFEAVNRQLKPEWKEHAGKEPHEIEFLRDYSNYLTPRLGIFGADTWTMMATWARNTILNLTILLLAFAGLLMTPRFVAWLSYILQANACAYLMLAQAFLVLGFFFVGLNLASFAYRPNTGCPWYGWYTHPNAIRRFVVIPILAAVGLVGTCIWFCRPVWRWSPKEFAIWLAFQYFWPLAVGWILGAGLRWILNRALKAPLPPATGSKVSWLRVIRVSFWTLFVAILILFPARQFLQHWSIQPPPIWQLLTFGTPLVGLVLLFVVVLHIGLLGRDMEDEAREWWSRLGAWVFIFVTGWLVIWAASIYAPLLMIWGGKIVGGSVGLAWVATTLWTVIAGKAPTTGKPGIPSWIDRAAKVGPYVFIAGFISIVALGVHLTLPVLVGSVPFSGIGASLQVKTIPAAATRRLRDLPPPVLEYMEGARAEVQERFKDLSPEILSKVKNLPPAAFERIKGSRFGQDGLWHRVLLDQSVNSWVFVCALLCGLAAIYLSKRVDINQFSMHLFYRNRLVRCYLGASNHPRCPHPFTGFDPKDDLYLADLKPAKGYTGPFPIINATVNMTRGEKLASQERKGASFTFTPMLSGYGYFPDGEPDSRPNSQRGTYRPTADYAYPPQGASLGTAFAISGAAASPNMGFHTSPPLAFLMTIFNVRLGWWLGNPRRDATWRKAGPPIGLGYLLKELVGRTNASAGYVYLSDGGHFDNLGIYELVRRKCRLIVACDATADSDYKFGDLGNAIRKCRDDFGVDIKIDLKLLRGRGKPKRTKSHVAMGTIHYENTFEGEKPGVLLYIKASLTKNADEPADVLEYAATHVDFPHDSTADQWFSESQFESYRMLGQHILEEAGKDNVWRLIKESWKWTGLDAERLNDYLKERFPSLYSPTDTSANASGV